MRRCLDDRIVFSHDRRQRKRTRRIGMTKIRPVTKDAINTIFFLIEPIVTSLIGKHQHDQHGHRHRRGEPEDIDGGKYFVLQEIPDPGFEIVEEHIKGLCGSDTG